MNTQNIEKGDIQGLLTRAYGKLTGAVYTLLKFDDSEKAKTYLSALADRLNTCDVRPGNGEAINLALTCRGLSHLNLSEDIINTFPFEFIEGMNNDVRKIMLGDTGPNDPANWVWGGNNKEDIHALLLVFGEDQAKANEVYQREKDVFSSAGISEVLSQEGCMLPEGREHFGFRDGISRPAIEGLHPKGGESENNPFKSGEFVLGYKNEYDNYSVGPRVNAPGSQTGLPSYEPDPQYSDLGKNGSFLIYRQMEQNVPQFWDYLAKQAKDNEETIKIASKMVGRWPSGTALVLSPDKDTTNPDESMKQERVSNKFGYWNEDKDGMKCPYGSHIRRTNPRDWLYTEKKSDVATEMVRKHAILRRGRAYGKPLTPDMETNNMIEKSKELNGINDGEKRGLHFIALVGHINRQFEFVQNAWVKSPNFAGMRTETDPLIGPREVADRDLAHPDNHISRPTQANVVPCAHFTFPDKPIRKRYHNVPQFTTVIGGAYFFMPGIRALKYIAS